MRTALLALALTGCAVTPFTQEPHLNRVTLNVQWLDEGQRPPPMFGNRAEAGAIIPIGQSAYSTIWTPRPRGFDDMHSVCTLGHEVLHSLGARH
jgi:hypothetical protein